MALKAVTDIEPELIEELREVATEASMAILNTGTPSKALYALEIVASAVLNTCVEPEHYEKVVNILCQRLKELHTAATDLEATRTLN